MLLAAYTRVPFSPSRAAASAAGTPSSAVSPERFPVVRGNPQPDPGGGLFEQFAVELPFQPLGQVFAGRQRAPQPLVVAAVAAAGRDLLLRGDPTVPGVVRHRLQPGTRKLCLGS